MGTLTEDIARILDRHLIGYAVKRICGIEVFDITPAGGKDGGKDGAGENSGEKDRGSTGGTGIIPLTVEAGSRAEAEEKARAVENAIERMTEGKTFSSRPLIVTSDRWDTRRNMMEDRILAHCNIFTPVYARNCEVRRIGKDEAAGFLSANHSYGDASCKYRYGLFLTRHTGKNNTEKMMETLPRGTMVAVSEFSNARRWQKSGRTIASYEWIRYASLSRVRINGGMGKILRAFIDEIHPDDIMTYADLEWSDGQAYRQLGFSPDGSKTPVMFGIDTGTSARRPLKEDEDAALYYRNLGSKKYRLKLTEYL